MIKNIIIAFILIYTSFAPVSANDLIDVFVYPNPWKPGDGLAETGTEAGIIFSNLPLECTIEIYSITGEKIHEIEHINNYVEVWNGTLESGKELASGLYIYLVKSGQDSKYGTFVVIR